MNEAAAALIERTDRALQGLEDEAIDRIYQALDASYKRLERDLLKAYSQQAENLTLLPNQRKLLILDQVKDLMSLVDTRSAAAIQKNFENLLRGANEQGLSVAASLSEAIANQKLESFADVSVEALKFQAVDGVKRLQRHGEEFASRASAVVEMGLVQGWGARKVASQLRSELGTTKGRAEAIARTETLSAHNSAIEANFKANNIELFQVFATSDERTCSTCSSRNQQVYKLGESRPPYHVRCRCTIAPMKREWLEAGLVDTAWSQKYREEGLKKLQAAGRSPNTGVSPFEKAAGVTIAPQPVWKPGDKPLPIPSPRSTLRQAPASAPDIAALEAEFKALEKEFDKLVDDDPVGAFRSPTAKRLFELEDQLKSLKQQATPTPEQAIEQSNRHLPYLDRAREIVGKSTLERFDRAFADTTPELAELKSKLAELDPEYDRLIDDLGIGSAIRSPLGQRYSKIQGQIATAQKQAKADAIEAMQELRSNLLFGMDVAAAKQLADKVKILKSANKQVPEAKLRELLSEFYQMTGGKGGDSLKKILKNNDRAHASANGDLNIGSNESERGYRVDLWHEMGHHLEFESGARRDAMLDWVKSRATGEAKMMKEINSLYADEDLAYPDHFVDPYVGKFYDDDSTEVISMGLQHFIDVETMLDFYRRDPEHFLMTIGAIRDD